MSITDSPLRDRMIFLVGARRSGTNWLQRVVGAHPDVALVPSETYLFSRGIAPLRERIHHGVIGSPGTSFVYMDRDELLDALRDLCDRIFLPFLRSGPPAERLAERTPEHVMCLDLIGEIYPDARVVHIVRDGRDVTRSLLSVGWRSAPGSVEAAAGEWRSAIEAAEKAAPGLAHYRPVRYEELLADPLGQVTAIYGWLGLRTEPHVVEAALMEAEVRFNVDVSAPEIGVGKWRESFSEDDLRAFMDVAGPTLAGLGYAAGDVAPGRPPAAAPADEPGARGRGRLRRRREGDPREVEREVLKQITENQRLLDRLVAALAGRRPGGLDGLVSPSAWVRFSGPGTDWRGRGAAARARLIEALAGDEVLRGRQVRGDLHTGLPTSTAVMTFELPDGSQHARVVAATIHGDRVTRLSYYQLPLAGD
jgi:hypothetical protein